MVSSWKSVTTIFLSFLFLFIFSVSTVSAQNDPPQCTPTQGGSCLESTCPAHLSAHPTWDVQCVDAQGPSGSSHYCCEVAPAPSPTPTPTPFPCYDPNLQFGCFSGSSCPVNWVSASQNPDTVCAPSGTCCWYNPPAATSTPVPTATTAPTATPVCTDDFQYNECVACNTSRPVYKNSCTGVFSTGADQFDSACASFCTATPQPTPTLPPPEATATPTPAPCAVTTSPSLYNLTIGGTGVVTASVTLGLGSASISQMRFGSYNTAIATVNPTSDSSSTYSTTVTGVSGGATAVWGTADLSDGRTCQSSGTTDTDINVAGPTATPTPTPTFTPTPTPTPTVGADSIDATPEPNQQQTNNKWQQMQIAVTLGTSPKGNVAIKTGNHPTIGSCSGSGNPCEVGWTYLSSLQNIGPGTYTWDPNSLSLTPGTTYTFGLFDQGIGALLATDPVDFTAAGTTSAPPPPPPGQQSCTLTVNSSTVSPGGQVSVDLSGPSGTYNMTCPDGTTRGPGSPGDPWACSTPNSPGTYQVSVSGQASCFANVRVAQNCTVRSTMNGPYPYVYAYRDSAYSNTNYLSVLDQWPQYFWCPEGGFCTYGIRGTQPISNAKRNDATYCGYTTIGAATGSCKYARFPIGQSGAFDNDDSAAPFNQPRASQTRALPNVVIHADSDCDSYTATTQSDGQTNGWYDSLGQSVRLPRSVGPSSQSTTNVSYTIWADTTSGSAAGRKFTRGVYFTCGSSGCFPENGAEQTKGPNDQPQFTGIRGETGHNLRFGFTDGVEPVCKEVSASPTNITRGETVNFNNGQGVAYGGKTIVGYGWDFDGNGLVDRETTTNATTYTYNGSSGTYPAQLFVKDESGLFSLPSLACTKSITVSCKNLTISPNPITIAPGQRLTVNATGLDGDPSKLTWILGNPKIAKFTFSTFPRIQGAPPVQIDALTEGSTTLVVYEGTVEEVDIPDPALAGSGCPAETITIPVTVRIPPWFQGTGGDMRIDSGFIDPLPAPTPPPPIHYASLDGAGGKPGVIFSGAATPNFGQGQASTTGWLISGSETTFTPVTTGVIRTSYSYMSTTARQSGITPTALPCTLINCTLAPGFANGVYKADTDVHLQSYTFPANKNYVILVDGNLFIEGDIVVPINSTATFSVSGNITVDKSVVTVEGFYSADYDIIIDGNGLSACSTVETTDDDKRVNFAGALVVNAKLQTGTLQNKRNLCANNQTSPSFTINERPDMILNSPEFIKAPNYIWEEVAP